MIYTYVGVRCMGNSYRASIYINGKRKQLGVSSPAKNVGTNLQTLVESFGLEWKNINGTLRDATPDLGAY